MRDRKTEIVFFIALVFYLIYHLLIRLFLSSTLELDESEQAFLSQEFQWGYNQQPPLYTWITILLLKIFGYTKFTFLILRSALLFFTHFFIYKISKSIYKNVNLAIITSLSLLLFFQFSVESFRQTHTVLVTCSAVAFIFQIIRMQKKSTWVDYMITGIIIAIGVLAKYNFILIVIATIMVMAFDRNFSKVLFSKKTIITLLVVILLIGRHGIWFIDFSSTFFEQTNSDLKTTSASYLETILPSIFVFTKGVFSFSAGFIIICIILFNKNLALIFKTKHPIDSRFILKLILLSLLFLLTIAVFTKDNKMHERWFQPFLILLPIYVLGTMFLNKVSKVNVYKTVLYFTAGVIMLYIPLGILIGPKLGFHERINKPFIKLSKAMKSEELLNGTDLILCNEFEVAGNLKLFFPDKKVDVFAHNNFFFDYSFENDDKVVFITTNEQNVGIVSKLNKSHVLSSKLKKTLKYHHSSTKYMSFYIFEYEKNDGQTAIDRS